MSAAPPAFRAELRAHNFHAVGAAVLSLFAAVIAWNLAYFFFTLILLGLTTAARGDFSAEPPPWISSTSLALAAALLIWGLIDAARRRFATASDRPIIGWHLIADFALLPVRLTFAIGGNLGAIRRLSPAEIDRAWDLLVTIVQAGKVRVSSLSLVETDPGRLHRLLGTLQMLNYIDLHRGEQDWFYTVCTPRLPQLHALLP
jgi:hypothetical protein